MGSGIADGTFTGTAEHARIIGSPNWSINGPTLSASNSFAQGPLAAFIGSGDLTFFLTTVNLDAMSVLGQRTAGLPNPAPFGWSTGVVASVEVIYEYVTPVPEPGTWAMMIAGLGLLGFAAGRRGLNATTTATV